MTYSSTRTRVWLMPVATAIAMACAAAPVSQALARSDASEISYPAYQGPKKTIAVSKFDAVGSFVGQFGGWDVGGGLAAMLTTELAQTNRFVVVERPDLDTILREKQMALTGVTRGVTGQQLLGAQTIVRGSVTTFEQNNGGGGLNIGLNLPGFNGGAAGRTMSGHIAIVLRLIDAETGAIISTSRVEKTVRSRSVALQGSVRNVSFGGDQFHNTSIGKAAEQAIAEAVAHIVDGMEQVPFQALVAKVDGDRVSINAGHNANLAPGARMRIVRTTDTVTDPQTGELLGSTRATVGDIEIVRVEDRYAVGRLINAAAPVQRSDVAQLVNY
jgi:curli biogenesis system outer membrane secretion channel CsgG